jgi:hypothetical protein
MKPIRIALLAIAWMLAPWPPIAVQAQFPAPKAPDKSLPAAVAPGPVPAAPAPVLWENKYFGDHFKEEIAAAASMGVTPVEITTLASVAEIGAGGRVFKWVVSKDGRLMGVPRLDKGDVWRGKVAEANDLIKHTTASGGQPVLAAGNARVHGDRVMIDRRSGHYRPDAASMEIARAKFIAAGFRVEVVEGVQ